MSVFLKHKARMKTAVNNEPAKAAVVGNVPAGAIGNQQLVALISNALEQDLAALKELKSVERKAEVKREQLIPKYRSYVQRLRSAGLKHDVLGYYLVWLFDTDAIGEAVEHALWCAENDVAMPARFSRDARTFALDAVIEWAAAEYDNDRSPEPYFSTLFSVAEGMCSQPWDVPDNVTAKLYRLHGLLLERAEKADAAIAALEIAHDMGGKVKTALEKLRKKAER